MILPARCVGMLLPLSFRLYKKHRERTISALYVTDAATTNGLWNKAPNG